MEKKLKLNSLAKNNLNEKEMSKIKGGGWTCGCGCHYANSGGSSIDANAAANYDGELFSPGGEAVILIAHSPQPADSIAAN